jgi:beta-lactam-binding protein with PASTA domain
MIEPGTVIDGRYEVLSRIGSGGMADVYLARDELLGRQVALKLLQHRFAEDQEFVERFRREASSAAGLSHPNVVAVFDRGEWDGTYYIAMEYLPGRPLKTVVREEGPMDPAYAIEIVVQILRAAKFAHKRGIIHRDLKPHNVILDEEGRAKVTDFGIARAGASDMTLTGSIMGTAQYLSPEQAQGQPVSETSDLYAVGIVLYELLTGAVPFDGETAVSIALKQVSAQPPPPSRLNAAVTPELDAVVARALAKSPQERFASAAEFIAALEQVSQRIGSPGVSSPGIGAPGVGTPGVGSPVPPIQSLPPAVALAGPISLGVGGDPGVGGDSVAGGPVPPGGVAANPTELAPAAPANEWGVLTMAPATEEDGEPDGDSWFKRHRWWVLGGVALVLIVGAALALALTDGSKVRVPTVLSEPQTLAETRLTRAGLKVSATQAASTTVAVGNVISQLPRAGSEVKQGSHVGIVVSTGPGSVGLPNVVGMTGAQAVAKLQSLGLRPTTQSQPSAQVKPGVTISTDPTAGTDVQIGSAVTVAVSSGPQQASVPEVVGSTEAEAKSTLKAAGLKVGTVTQQPSSAQTPGTVLTQSLTAGTMVKAGETVSLTVAQAPKEVAVPEVVGQNATQAAAALGQAGFNAKSVSRSVEDPTQVGVVLGQSPAGGRMAPRGATVTIAVGVLQSGTTTGTTTTPSTTTSTTTTPAANPAAPVP